MKKTNLFLVGCGRSGTTSLYYYLKQHPDIFMSEVKGPDFFADIPNDGYPEFFGNEKKYLSLFNDAKSEKYLGDASHYFHIKSSPKKIKEFNPNSKIIIILRNPFRVIRSYYTGGSIPIGTELNNENYEKIVQVKELLDSLKYSENVKRWFKFFGRKNVHVIIFEDLIENPSKEYVKICKFLNLKSSPIPEYKSYTDSGEMKHGWIKSIISSFSATPKLFMKKIIGEKNTEKLRDLVIKVTKKEGVKKDISINISTNLQKRLLGEISRTEKLLNKKMPSWYRNPLHNL